jgi:hypothetical protein
VAADHPTRTPAIDTRVDELSLGVASPIHSARIVRFEQDTGDPGHSHALRHGARVPLAPFLAQHDIVVNCVLQNPDTPLTFVTEDGLNAFAPGSLIVDVSCDEGMGFSWARPCTAPELVAAVLTCGLGERPGWGKIPVCGTSSSVSDHGPGLRLAGAAGA